MAIKFCPRCKSVMVLTKKDGKAVWRCPKCGYEEEAGTGNAKLVERTMVAKRDDKPIVLTKSSEEALPKVRKTCQGVVMRRRTSGFSRPGPPMNRQLGSISALDVGMSGVSMSKT